VQHSLRAMGKHALTWGAEYRYDVDRVDGSDFIAFLPPEVHQKWASLFGQDEVALAETVRATVGARVERNDYTGYEFLPNARLAWRFSPDQLLWTAASRTVRAPSRLDRDTFVPGKPPFLLAGGPDVRSEVANVYEVGYRGLPAAKLSYSMAVFHADYDHLRTQELAPSRTYLFYANQMHGRTNGVETWGSYQASSAWRLSAGFTQLSENLQLEPGSFDLAAPKATGRDAAQTWMLRSLLDVPYHCELDAMLRHVSALWNPSVPSYLAVDLRVGWRPHEQLELSIAGRNLFGGAHAEFADVLTRSELRPNVFFKVLGRFR